MRYREILREMTYREAVKVFAGYGVPKADELDLKTLGAKRRQLAMKAHPDQGGSEAAITAINSAFDVLKRFLTAGPPPASNGGGGYGGGGYRPPPPPSEVPAWAWAGHSGGLPPQSHISRQDYTDLNFVKKRMWELSGQSKESWTILNFDGHFFRGMITVYGSEAIFDEMAKAMITWDRFNEKRAIFVMKRKEPTLYLIWSDGEMRHPPIPMEHDSPNLNPSNDQHFVRRLPEMLDRIRDGGSAE